MVIYTTKLSEVPVVLCLVGAPPFFVSVDYLHEVDGHSWKVFVACLSA